MLKRTLVILIVLFLVLIFLSESVSADVRLSGYCGKDGTYVRGHWRGDPDGNSYSYWSFPRNVNPHALEIAPRKVKTYLKNYYKKQPIVLLPKSPGSAPVTDGDSVRNSPKSFCGLAIGNVLGGQSLLLSSLSKLKTLKNLTKQRMSLRDSRIWRLRSRKRPLPLQPRGDSREILP